MMLLHVTVVLSTSTCSEILRDQGPTLAQVERRHMQPSDPVELITDNKPDSCFAVQDLEEHMVWRQNASLLYDLLALCQLFDSEFVSVTGSYGLTWSSHRHSLVPYPYRHYTDGQERTEHSTQG